MSEEKKFSPGIVLNIILLIAVAVLFYFQFSENGTSKDIVEEDKTDSLMVENADNEELESAKQDRNIPTDIKIVYVDTDKMWEEYKFVDRNLKILERSEKQMRDQYERKYKKLEKDYTDFMRLGQQGLLSETQQQQKAMDLENQKKEMDALDASLSEKLVTQRETLNGQINDSIVSFLDRYRKKNDYTLILQYSYLNSILSADSVLDVTDDVVNGLNKEYNNFKDKL